MKVKKFIQVNDLFRQVKIGGVSWIDRLSFLHIFIAWLSIIIFFGIVYHFSQNDTSFLFYNLEGSPTTKIKDAIYFSFITATTTGFGDIIPHGLFKLIAIFEVVFGLLLLAFVTSKLVSIKQDAILGELYELSLNEKVNRLRSSLLLFRQNLDRIITKIEEGDIQKRELDNIYLYFSSMDDSLNETLTLMERSKYERFIKNIDPVSTQLVFNSIISSFEKLHELISMMNQKKIEWKTELNTNLISQCIAVNKELFKRLSPSEGLAKATVRDLTSRKDKIIGEIENSIGKK